MKKKTPTRGGARQGAGRKPSDPDDGARWKLSLTLPAHIYGNLAAAAKREGLTLSAKASQIICKGCDPT
jgi:hypothetical protein